MIRASLKDPTGYISTIYNYLNYIVEVYNTVNIITKY